MNTVLIPPGPGGYGKGLWLPVGSGKGAVAHRAGNPSGGD